MSICKQLTSFASSIFPPGEKGIAVGAAAAISVSAIGLPATATLGCVFLATDWLVRAAAKAAAEAPLQKFTRRPKPLDIKTSLSSGSIVFLNRNIQPEATLLPHQKVVMERAKKVSIVCQYCGKTFKNPSNAARHYWCAVKIY